MCANGTPPKGDACPVPMQMCLKCDPNWTLDPKTLSCKPICYCVNGIPAKAWDNCKRPAHKCVKCFVGFNLDQKTGHCPINRCPCKMDLVLDSRRPEWIKIMRVVGGSHTTPAGTLIPDTTPVEQTERNVEVWVRSWHNLTAGLSGHFKLHVPYLDLIGDACPKPGKVMCLVCKVGTSLTPTLALWWAVFAGKNSLNTTTGKPIPDSKLFETLKVPGQVVPAVKDSSFIEANGFPPQQMLRSSLGESASTAALIEKFVIRNHLLNPELFPARNLEEFFFPERADPIVREKISRAADLVVRSAGGLVTGETASFLEQPPVGAPNWANGWLPVTRFGGPKLEKVDLAREEAGTNRNAI